MDLLGEADTRAGSKSQYQRHTEYFPILTFASLRADGDLHDAIPKKISLPPFPPTNDLLGWYPDRNAVVVGTCRGFEADLMYIRYPDHA